MTAKVTYSLDATTVLEIQELADSWHVPKSEVIRRSVRLAARQRDSGDLTCKTPLAALDALQQDCNMDVNALQQWAADVRQERHHSNRL